MKDDLLSALGFTLCRHAPQCFVASIRYYGDRDGFECMELEYLDGTHRGINITGQSTANILRRLAEAIESKEVLRK